ncbi:MAG: polysaccharide deacetylase family protein [Armatimonadetes bacterium]|nr:polysaccharide deacetylase family protein [Armatimonadota bacterium]
MFRKRSRLVAPVTLVCALGLIGCGLFSSSRGVGSLSAAVLPASDPPADAGFQGTDPYWEQAREKAYRTVAQILAQNDRELRRGIQRSKLLHGDYRKKQIALTFDDGPHPAFTPKLLALLAKYKVKATFFVVGEMCERHPELVRAELAAGHVIANHTYHHVNLVKIPATQVAAEISACGEVVQSITGRAPHLFRPPGGDYNDRVAEVSEALGYTICLWTDDPGDYANPPAAKLAADTRRWARNGGIILLHDGPPVTLKILPKLITDLRRRGFEFVTIDQMLGYAPTARTASRPAHGSR